VPDPLTFEQAIWRLTGMPATIHALDGRGFLREGAWADILVLDRAKLKVGPTRLARDFPAGTERYVVDAEGYAAVIVNGAVVLEDGKHTGALPGHVLRGA
jgi:N-acyl-D-aspartate/D-glutamate deacylase